MGRNMVFRKGVLSGYNLTFRSSWLLDQSSPDFFSQNAGGIAVIKYLYNFEYLYPFQRYLPSNFEVIRNPAKFCMFLAPKYFWGGPPKFSTCAIKFGLLLIIVQNFAALGRRSLEIPWRNEKKQICSKT